MKKLNESGEPIRNISFSQEDKEMINTNTGSEDSDSFLSAMPDMPLNEKDDDDQNYANSKHDAVT